MKNVIIQIKGQIEDDVTTEEVENKIANSDICDIEYILVEEN